MRDFDSRLLKNTIGRRPFLESCVGVIAGTMATHTSPAFAQTSTNSSVNFFPGFRRQTVETTGTQINVVVGGDGPPLLLLHGPPKRTSNGARLPRS